ncbi:MAG: T9SS type A sorting domain-containing protein, partial [Prevotella sp.]|nr:T9SS type A sorting domain-containing protein [Prevotella sp.]
QYNQVSTDGSAHFTKLENMGWNLKGMPWLVSGYQTDQVSNGQTAMNAPHVFYGMNGEGAYEELSKGSVYTALSWEDGTTMSFGSAFFTQTAVIGDGNTEKVTFALPPLLPSKTPDPAAKPFVAIADEEGQSDAVEVRAIKSIDAIDAIDSIDAIEAIGSKASLAFSLGSDGVKWQSFNDSVPQVYLLDNSGVALSLAGQAPVGVEMAMGYRAARAGQLTVSLPNADAFEGQSVWLRDKETGEVTDLTLSSYTLQAEPGYTDNRLTLQIGGVRPDGGRSGEASDAMFTLRAQQHRIVISNVKLGDRIVVYNVTGARVEAMTAEGETATTYQLPAGVYMVRVGEKAKKIAVR